MARQPRTVASGRPRYGRGSRPPGNYYHTRRRSTRNSRRRAAISRGFEAYSEVGAAENGGLHRLALSDADAAPVLTRSHLDSQSLGGRFDGQLDVLTPPETLRTLDDEGIETRHPVGIVTWTNEQGSRLEERDAPVGVAEGVFGIVVPCDGPWPTLALCRP